LFKVWEGNAFTKKIGSKRISYFSKYVILKEENRERKKMLFYSLYHTKKLNPPIPIKGERGR
jgi:hypothetical protein